MDEKTIVSDELIYVAMLPHTRADFDLWLSQRGLKLGRIPPMGDSTLDQIPVYFVTPAI